QTIKTAFDVQGGHTVDISKKDTTGIDFIYTAPPQVKIVSGLDTVPDCVPQKIVLDEGVHVVLKLKPYEQYELTYDEMDENEIIDEGVCYIDTADFHIINGIAGEDIDTLIEHGILIDTFIVGDPNPTPPYLKNLQIVLKNQKGQEGSLTKQVIVTGIKAKLETFSTILPEIPSVILRDPPGDGSYSYLEKNKKVCQQFEMTDEIETGGGVGVKILLGPDLTTIEAPLGVGIITTNDNVNNINIDAEGTFRKLSSHSFETCLSFDSRIATSADDLIVGGERGGDLYMGDALNIIFGFADQVTYDYSLCEVDIDTIISVEPGDFATTFIYSEFYITGFLIPNLTILYEDDEADPADTARYGQSIRRWEAIVDNNRAQKEDALFIRNISFDAGTEFEYSETSDTTTSEIHEDFTNSATLISADIGLTLDGFGFITSPKVIINTSNGGRDGTGTSQGVTTGYVLKDDDPGDAFSIDVGMDDVYKTPVFNLKAGQSNCPWEPGTANREGTNIGFAPGYSNEVINVPSNEAAVFKLVLGNLSATNEQWTYFLTSIAEHNPDGAIIKYNGHPLNYLQPFIIPYGDSQEVTITVERGPVEYEYDNLLVAELSACEYERNLTLSIPVDDDEKFFSGLELSVHFIRPCSEVTMNVPEQNWVVDNTGSPNLPITVTGYDLNNTDFQLIRVQYRRADGDGAWINLPSPYLSAKYNPNWSGYTNQSALGPVFTQFTFNTTGLSDGEYELHAWAVCTGTASDKPGFSQIIRGRIDREPPKLVGIPEPSDGVLQVGDEISFTFNKPINCNQLWAGTVIDHVNVYNTRTNTLVPSKVECGDNKIVIDSLAQNEFIENEILRVDLDNISDLVGNTLVHTDWEFYVDRNELAWLTDSAGITKYPDEEKSITVKIHNRGGYPVPFRIDSLQSGVIPEWLNVSPNQGTLAPNEIREITFTAPDTMSLGWIKDTVILHTVPGQNPFFMGGDENLPFDVRNICRPPAWAVNHAVYQQTMTFVVRLQINGTFSSDPEDQIAAFIEGEVRGTAKLIKSLNNVWMAYITVYGNTADAGEPITFEGFDASACLHYPLKFGAGDVATFTANGTQGSPNSPRTLTNDGNLLSDIALNKGWNWISFNLGFPDSTINAVLNHVPLPNGDLIKDQNNFSVFNNNTWSGSMDTIGNQSMYMYQSVQPNTIKIIGSALSPATNPITITPPWSWIGYIPTFPLPVNTALASLTPVAGDIIKSQTAFAQYVGAPTNKWVGNLTTLEPLHGYLLKTTNGGTLTYPSQPFTGGGHHASRSREVLTTFWNVNASQYEHNMTLIGFFNYDDMNATTADMELGAFVGDEIRGVGQAVYIEYLDEYMFFMTCYANKSGEQLHFKLYDTNTGEIQELHEKMPFVTNDFEGSIENPIPFTLQTTGIGDVESDLSFNVQPNPFRDETVCRMELPDAQQVHLIITDMQGKNVFYTSLQANAGMNLYTWKGCSTSGAPLSKGIYFIRMETKEGVLTKKVVLQR
ncbi:MAG TPA: T9SS type A sorting domain-containing protein, partial [Saprospiraceae bacterium]|nr:T9SS type A sorting domain-containing protein [Saprospiraceae bacterium]